MALAQRPKLGLETLDERIVPAVIDLTTAGTSDVVNGAIVHRMDGQWAPNNGGAQSHGRGALTTVLGVNHNNNEAGYNTTATGLQAGMDTTVAQALNLSQIPIVTVGGVSYYEFVLNANENSGKNARNISVDAFQLFFSNVSTLKNYNAAAKTLGANANKVSAVYDLDASGDNSLLVRAKANVNATGEVAVLVPVSNFAGANANSFVYIYTKISGASGGDEQWGVRQAPRVTPPATGPVSVTGRIFQDGWVDGVFDSLLFNGQFDAGEGLSGVTVSFTGSDIPGGDQFYTTQADDDGLFTFTGPIAAVYQLSVISNNGYSHRGVVIGDANNDGEFGGEGDGTPNGNETIINIDLAANAAGVGYGFIMGNTGPSE